MPDPTSSYQGEPGGPSDPATPGSYCLARCYCTTCPQYARQQAALAQLIEQERGQRIAEEGRRSAAKPRGRRAA